MDLLTVLIEVTNKIRIKINGSFAGNRAKNISTYHAEAQISMKGKVIAQTTFDTLVLTEKIAKFVLQWYEIEARIIRSHFQDIQRIETERLLNKGLQLYMLFKLSWDARLEQFEQRGDLVLRVIEYLAQIYLQMLVYIEEKRQNVPYPLNKINSECTIFILSEEIDWVLSNVLIKFLSGLKGLIPGIDLSIFCNKQRNYCGLNQTQAFLLGIEVIEGVEDETRVHFLQVIFKKVLFKPRGTIFQVRFTQQLEHILTVFSSFREEVLTFEIMQISIESEEDLSKQTEFLQGRTKTNGTAIEIYESQLIQHNSF